MEIPIDRWTAVGPQGLAVVDAASGTRLGLLALAAVAVGMAWAGSRLYRRGRGELLAAARGARLPAPAPSHRFHPDAPVDEVALAAVTSALLARGLEPRAGRDGSVLFCRRGRPVVRVATERGPAGARLELTSRLAGADRDPDPAQAGPQGAVPAAEGPAGPRAVDVGVRGWG
jgi:hypothetical protein